MCSTGNYIQHPVINFNEKEYEKNTHTHTHTHTHITGSLCCIAEIKHIVNQLYFTKLQEYIIETSRQSHGYLIRST